jgi:hypothetical protein
MIKKKKSLPLTFDTLIKLLNSKAHYFYTTKKLQLRYIKYEKSYYVISFLGMNTNIRNDYLNSLGALPKYSSKKKMMKDMNKLSQTYEKMFKKYGLKGQLCI